MRAPSARLSAAEFAYFVLSSSVRFVTIGDRARLERSVRLGDTRPLTTPAGKYLVKYPIVDLSIFFFFSSLFFPRYAAPRVEKARAEGLAFNRGVALSARTRGNT